MKKQKLEPNLNEIKEQEEKKSPIKQSPEDMVESFAKIIEIYPKIFYTKNFILETTPKNCKIF